MGRHGTVRSRTVLLDLLVMAFVVALIGCGGGGAGGGDTTGTTTGTGTGGITLATGFGTISGTVVDASVGTPLSGATVTGGGKLATSAVDGSFTLSQVPAGNVQVIASATGFGSKSAIVSLAAGGTAAVNLVLGTASSSGGGGGSSATGPVISSSNPSNNSTNVDVSTQILFTLDQGVQRATLVANDGTTVAPSVVFTRISTTGSVSDSGTCTVTPFGLNNTFVYRPGLLAPLIAGTQYALAINNRLVGTNNQPSPGSRILFTTAGTPPTGSGGSVGNSVTPVITASNPANGSTGVDPNTRVFITLSADTDVNTVTPASVRFTQLTTPVQELTTINVSLTSLNPPTFELLNIPLPLLGTTSYQVSINNNVQSVTGVRSLGSSVRWVTRAGTSAGGQIIPILSATSPRNTTTEVDVNSRILMTFNVDILLSSLNLAGAVKLSRRTTPEADLGTVSVTSTAVPNTYEILDASTGQRFALASETQYRVSLTNDIQASGANGGFLQPSAFQFTTARTQGGSGDTSPPLLASSNPGNGETNVPLATRLTFSFNELVKVASVNPQSVRLSRVLTPTASDTNALVTNTNTQTVVINGVPTLCASDFEYTPGSLSLIAGQSFRVALTNDIVDTNGNRLISTAAAPASFSFTTENVQGLPQGPSIASSNPSPESTGVDPSTRLFITFDKNMVSPLNQTAFPSTIPNFSVVPGAVQFQRLTVSAEADSAVVPPSNSITLTVVSGPDAGVYFLPNATFPTVPLLYRPDPVGAPRKFEYVPGRVKLEGGLVRYTLFLTNSVQDLFGNPAQSGGANTQIFFTTGVGTSQPSGGPRLVGANPPPGAFVGPNARVFLTFDKDIVDPANPLPLDPRAVSITALNGGDCASLSFCDLNPGGDISNCTPCPFVEFTTNVTPTFFPDGVTINPRVVEVEHTTVFPAAINGNMFVKISAALQARDGTRSGGETTYFFCR